MEAHFEILRPLLDLWCRNEFKVVSNFDFEFRLALHAKQCKLKLIIHIVLKNMTFVNDFKYRYIIYYWKSFFS